MVSQRYFLSEIEVDLLSLVVLGKVLTACVNLEEIDIRGNEVCINKILSVKLLSFRFITNFYYIRYYCCLVKQRARISFPVKSLV